MCIRSRGGNRTLGARYSLRGRFLYRDVFDGYLGEVGWNGVVMVVGGACWDLGRAGEKWNVVWV